MPNFSLGPKPEDLAPRYDEQQIQKQADASKKLTRAEYNSRLENSLGPLKPVGQVFNAWMSPDFIPGVFTGPINAVSRFTNALGDRLQGKKEDVSDAWVISDQQVRNNNPFRYAQGSEITPADEPGLRLGETAGGAIAGAAVVGLAGPTLGALPGVATATAALRASRVGAPLLKYVLPELATTAAAVPFIDQRSNLANLPDNLTLDPADRKGIPFLRQTKEGETGFRLPGRVEEGDSYLGGAAKGLMVEGVLVPLTVFAPLGYGLSRMESKAAATAAETSATARATSEQTQVRQVSQQRQRLQDMGLVETGEAGQLQLTFDSGIDPEIKTQVRQLQTQRGQLIKQATESGQDVGQELANIDQQIGDLIQSGRAQDAMDARPPVQPELDMPDGRPELDTYLANLDELSDAELRQIHSRVWREDADARMVQEQEGLQQRVAAAQQQIEQINARREAAEITDVGAKRLLTKAQKELEAAQLQLTAMRGRASVPESLVGDQLQLRMDQQLVLDMLGPVKLPPFKEITSTASEFGYRTPDDYRNALTGWTRDQLRRLAMPESSPEVAALVKARTGRRVWQAKKQDIIDALVEISEQRGRYLPPEPEQLAMQLKANDFGDSAPLFDRPAELDVPGMGKVLDADGNEVVVPLEDYAPRGMDPETRERLKAKILEKAILNGEVQAPFSPLPDRPSPRFDQGSFINDLLADENGQLPLAYATDAIEPYKAGGKGAEAWIDEVRLRYEYRVLDAEAQKAYRQAYLAERGWDQMTWDQKKQSGLVEEGIVPKTADEVIEAPPPPDTKPETFEWTPEGTLPQVDVEAMKKLDGTDNAKRMQQRAAREEAAQRKELKLMRADAAAQGAALDNQINKLEELIQRGQCNG